MNSFILMLAAFTFVSTLIGGLLVLRYKRSLPYIFAFAAGSLIGVSFLDLLPESLDLAVATHVSARAIFITVVVSFFLYNLIERFFATHHLHEHDEHAHVMGPIGAGSLVVHSFFDGAAIGAAFHVNAAVGLIVALAVIFHDFTDGINTVTVMLRNRQKSRSALVFLVLDALAPVLGVLLTTYVIIPEAALAFLLAFFVGEFLYIGASTLVPETKHTSRKTIIGMAAGIALIIALTSLI